MAKVLLVEDNEMNRDMLSGVSSAEAFEVIFAVDGQQGVDLARSERPDIILMDMSLPVIDGWEATRRVKADDATRSVPVIGLDGACHGRRSRKGDRGRLRRLRHQAGRARPPHRQDRTPDRRRERINSFPIRHGAAVSNTAADERLNRALTAFLRQEVQAPATAVTEFLDMIIEDARRLQLDAMLADLDRMRGASVQLNTFVKGIIRDFDRGSPGGRDREAFPPAAAS